MSVPATAPTAVSTEARARQPARTLMLTVTATAWLLIFALEAPGFGRTAHNAAAAAGVMHPAQMRTMPQMSAQPPLISLPSFLTMWSTMLVAMMPPLLIGPLRHLSARSLPRRGLRAGALFVAAYAAVWTVCGLLALPVANALNRLDAAGAVTLGLAAFWQICPARQRCLNRHHARPPIAAFGRAADIAALRFAATHATWCVGACWALMLLPLVFPDQHLAIMGAVSLWMWAEQFNRPAAPAWHLPLPVTAMRIIASSATHLARRPTARLPSTT